MIDTMRAFSRRVWLVAPVAMITLVLPAPPAWRIARAAADHGGPLRSAPMSPMLVGVLAGALTLAAGIIVVVIAMLLTKKPPPSE